MNIFKIGLFLSVLLCNLSCAIIPDDPLLSSRENVETNYTFEENDLNITDHSFIELDQVSASDIERLLKYLIQHGFHDKASIKSIKQLPAELNFSPNQLTELESSLEVTEISSSQKKLLHSLINHIRTERPY